MRSLGPYSVHPFAEMFPLIEGEEFDDLVRSVKEDGLGEPIMLTPDGSTIVDGRNRFRACDAAGRDPIFETLPPHYDDELILHHVLRKNLARRHLNPGQIAMVTLRVEEKFAEIAKRHQIAGARAGGNVRNAPKDGEIPKVPADRREPSSGERKSQEAVAMAAKATGARPRTVQRAKAVRRDAPDLAEQVERGTLALDAAERERKNRLKTQPSPEPTPRPSRTTLTLVTDEGIEVLYPKPEAKAKFNETRGEGISWAKWSWNPVTGCRHGCEYCYARELATRESYRASYPVGFTPLFHHERLEAPANTNIPRGSENDPAWRRVFVCSMADLYGRWVSDEWLHQVHDSMLANPQWEYLLLTKFPSRYHKVALPPLAWVGTSVDSQRRVATAEQAMTDIGNVKVKWLSLEPLREPLRFSDLSMFDWVVIGAQTETRQPDGVVPALAPAFEWVADIVAQAREAGCRVHLKPNLLGQTSAQLPGMALPDEYPELVGLQ